VPTLDLASPAPRKLGFALNLTVGWDGDDPSTDDSTFMPWVWPQLLKVRYFWRRANGTPLMAPSDADIRPKLDVPSPSAPPFSLFTEQLRRKFDDAKAQRTNLILKRPAAGNERAALQYRLDERPANRPWHATLNHVSTYPFPFPQGCNVSHFFRVDEVAGADSLVAAPVLITAAGGRFPQANYSPADPATAGADPTTPFANGAVEWAYAPAAPVAVVARLQPAPADAHPSDDFINFRSLWITPPVGVTNNFTADWQADLERRMADAFQFAQFTLDFMRDDDPAARVGAVLDAGTNLQKCVSIALATLRDVVGLGAVAGPDGVRIAKRLFQLFPDIVQPALLDTLDQMVPGSGKPQWDLFEQPLFPLLADWRAFLRAFLAAEVPDAAPLLILRDPPQTAQDDAQNASAQQAIAELDWLMGTLLDVRRDERQQPSGAPRQAVLWRLFVAQWKKALDASGLGDPLKRALVAALDAMLARPERVTGIDLRQQLLLSNLGRFWGAFVSQTPAAGDPLGHKLLADCFPAFLRYYAQQRVGLDLPAPPPECTLPASPPLFRPPVPDADKPVCPAAAPPNDPTCALAVALRAKFDVWVAAFRDALTPTAPPKPTDTPHAITVQAARLQADPQAHDPLELISGIGVLMRERGTTRWLPLNMASPTTQADKIELLPGRDVLVPYRLHYRGDLRQVSVSYNNHPLCAESPLSDLRMTGTTLEQPRGPADGLIRYAYSPNARMPGLKFGSSYDFALFAILNSGALPRELSDPDGDSPCSLKATFDDPPDDAIIRAVPYPRLVRIGALRAFNCELRPKGDGTFLCDDTPLQGLPRYRPLELAPLPEQVFPRARDLAVFDAGGTADTASKPSVILLTPADWPVPDVPAPERFGFKLRLPATSWECWNVWQSSVSSVTAAVREEVLADYGRKTRINSLLSETERNIGLEKEVLPDDPVVEQKIFFILEREQNGALVVVGSESVPVMTGAGATGLEKFQSLAVPVICEHVAATAADGLAPLSEAGQPTRLSVKVKGGEVYRLTACACLTADNHARKFGAGVVATFNPPPGVNTGGLLLVSPSHFAIEAATATLPKEDEVYGATTTKFFSDRGAWKLRVSVTGKDAATGNPVAEFRHVHRAEIDRQVWRWLGRPTLEHPDLERDYDATPASLQDRRLRTLRWEAVEFGERENSDHITHDMQVEKDSAGARSFSFEELIGKEEDEAAAREKSLDLRGLHFRYATRLFSRYEGILPAGAASAAEGAQQLPNDTGRPTVRNVWHSQFAPCRRKPPVVAPKVRFVLPLTESFGREASGSPGVLVVLDERWHEVGGIGESMEAEVVLTPDPGEPPADPKKFYFELGPDPIVTRRGLLDSVNADRPAELGRVRFSGPVGPVGHFFDLENNNALFANSSFLLPAPAVDPSAGDVRRLGWYFARVRLRRTIRTRLPDAGPAARAEYFPGAAWKRATLVSDYTEPFWVQFLPEFSIYDGFEQDISTLRPSVSIPTELEITARGARPTLQLLDPKGAPVKLDAYSSDSNVFSLYAVLTTRVFDLTGRTDQEAFVGLFKRNAAGGWDAEDALKMTAWATTAPAGRPQQFVVRVIEVQEPKPFATSAACAPGATLWDKLFGKSDDTQRDCDTKARIVRISRPIESTPSGVICGG